MTLDLHVPTLVVAALSVSFATSMLLLLAWLQNRTARALYYWGVANLVGTAAGILLFRQGLLPDIVSIAAANAFLIFAYALSWSGTRVFEGRSPSITRVIAGPALWLGVCMVPAFYGSAMARGVLASSLLAAYTLLTLGELWRGRKANRLASRWPAIILLSVHCAFHIAHAWLIVRAGSSAAISAMNASIAGAAVFAVLIHVIAIIFLMIALTKEKLELQQRQAAETDSLTGAMNRRAYFENGAALLADVRAKHDYAGLLAFDLDKFKKINDRWGHAAGDMVLERFALHARRALGSDVLFARIGGEEFSALICGRDHASMFEIAENLRAAIEETMILLPSGERLSITVSIGASFASGANGHDIEGMLRQADQALYCAKHNGRNRVEVYAPEQAESLRWAA